MFSRNSKSWITVVALGLVVVFMATPLQLVAQDLKVGYVDLQDILTSYKGYEAAMDKLDKYRTDLQERIDEDKKEIQSLREELKNSELFSQKRQQEKKQELMGKMQSFEEKARRSQQLMERKKQEFLEPVLEKVKSAVEATAADRGFDVVHRYGGQEPSTVLWVSERVDLTQRVIQSLPDSKTVDSTDSSQ